METTINAMYAEASRHEQKARALYLRAEFLSGIAETVQHEADDAGYEAHGVLYVLHADDSKPTRVEVGNGLVEPGPRRNEDGLWPIGTEVVYNAGCRALGRGKVEGLDTSGTGAPYLVRHGDMEEWVNETQLIGAIKTG